MSKKVRVGIIGTSWWTDLMFLPSLNSHPAAEIVAICGRNRERGEALAKEHHIAEVYTDYRALIKEAELDAVVVATPDDLHFSMTMAALEAGLHVLCEKPMALNVAHAKQMTEAATSAGVKHMVLFTWRWIPIFQYVKQLIDDGFVGRCYQASFRFLGGYGRNTAYTWRYDGKRSNGVASDLGAHMIDLAHWFVGDASKISANLSTFVSLASVDEQPLTPNNDSAFISVQFANQAQGMIQVSSMAHKAEREFQISVELYGENGSLEIDYTVSGNKGASTLYGARQDEETFTLMEIPEAFLLNLDLNHPFDPFIKQSVGARLFIDSILEDKMPSPNFHDGVKVQEVIDATVASHRDGCWISVGD